jgi:hypothetical protein
MYIRSASGVHNPYSDWLFGSTFHKQTVTALKFISRLVLEPTTYYPLFNKGIFTAMESTRCKTGHSPPLRTVVKKSEAIP